MARDIGMRRHTPSFRHATILQLVSLTLLLACLGPPTENENPDQPGPNDIKILFIGNSLTFFNAMPAQVAALAEQAGIDVFVDESTVGGASLEYHSGYWQTVDKIREHEWDYVILQGSSYAIAFPETHQEILPAIVALEDMIHENDPGTQIVFFLDWAMRDGVLLGETVYTYAELQPLIIDGTLLLADSLSFAVAPVGSAWNTVVNERPDIDLFGLDGAHPSLKGSYLQACVYFSTLFLQSSEGIPYYATLEVEEAEYLQRIASETVLDSLALWTLSP